MPLPSMDRRPTTMAALMMLATMTSSCQNAKTADAGPGDAANAPAAVPEVRPSINPSPAQRYMLTLRFDGLPGEVADLDATADFEVENRECVPYDFTRAVGGVRLPPRHSVPLTLERVDAGTWTAVVHEDALLDEDYYGLGVCHWALNNASVHFRSNATRFVGGIPADRLLAGGTMVDHFLVRDFAQKPEPMEVVFGEEAADYYQASAGPQFTLTITARREAP